MIRENECEPSLQEDWKSFPLVNGENEKKETKSKRYYEDKFWQMPTK